MNLVNKYFIFQVSLNFDPVKEILKIRYQIYILKEKVTILMKIHVTMKPFAPPFFDHFCLSLNRKKRVVMRAMRKKLNIFTPQLPIDYILEHEISTGTNTDIHKNEAREIDCLCCREVDAMLFASPKSPERESSISQSSFYRHPPDY